MSVYVRIFLRYAAGFLIAKGILSQDLGDALAGDPDIIAAAETLAGFGVAVATEWYYRAAKKFGWPT